MRYLIIGGRGTLGAAIKQKLEARGDTADACNEDVAVAGWWNLYPLFKQYDFIFFLTFRAGGAVYLKDKQFSFGFIAENVAILKNVFAALEATKTPFLYTSTQMATMNFSAYGVMKRLAEFYTESLGGLYVRFWNPYGVEKDPSRFHAICDFCQMAKRDGVIKMKTTGDESRQFLYNDDAAEAMIICADNYGGFQGKPLDITSFEWVTMLTVAQTIGGITGATVIPATETDWVQRDAKIEPNKFILDYWKPTTDLETGLKHIIEAMP